MPNLDGTPLLIPQLFSTCTVIFLSPDWLETNQFSWPRSRFWTWLRFSRDLKLFSKALAKPDVIPRNIFHIFWHDCDFFLLQPIGLKLLRIPRSLNGVLVVACNFAHRGPKCRPSWSDRDGRTQVRQLRICVFVCLPHLGCSVNQEKIIYALTHNINQTIYFWEGRIQQPNILKISISEKKHFVVVIKILYELCLNIPIRKIWI